MLTLFRDNCIDLLVKKNSPLTWILHYCVCFFLETKIISGFPQFNSKHNCLLWTTTESTKLLTYLWLKHVNPRTLPLHARKSFSLIKQKLRRFHSNLETKWELNLAVKCQELCPLSHWSGAENFYTESEGATLTMIFHNRRISCDYTGGNFSLCSCRSSARQNWGCNLGLRRKIPGTLDNTESLNDVVILWELKILSFLEIWIRSP